LYLTIGTDRKTTLRQYLVHSLDQTPHPPLQSRTLNAGHSRLYPGRGGECLKPIALRADNADSAVYAVYDLDALDERAEMIAAIAT
jgi:hypothetical protein